MQLHTYIQTCIYIYKLALLLHTHISSAFEEFPIFLKNFFIKSKLLKSLCKFLNSFLAL